MTERKFPNSELEGSLKRVFVELKLPAIQFDGHEAGSEFKRAVINYGVKNGLLEQGRMEESSQWTQTSYHLTDKGKEYFKLN